MDNQIILMDNQIILTLIHQPHIMTLATVITVIAVMIRNNINKLMYKPQQDADIII